MIALDHTMLRQAVQRSAQQEESIELKLLGPTLWIEGVAPVIRELDELVVRVTYRGISRGPITIMRTEPQLPEPWLAMVAQMIDEALCHDEVPL